MKMKNILFIMGLSMVMSLFVSCSSYSSGTYSYAGRTYHKGATGVRPDHIMQSSVVGISPWGGYAAGNTLHGVLGGVSGRRYGYGGYGYGGYGYGARSARIARGRY